MMKALFLGSTAFSYYVCEKIVEMGIDVVGIITSRERFRISYCDKLVHNIWFRDVERFAKRGGIPIIRTSVGINGPRYFNLIKKRNPNLILAAGWYYLIPKKIRALAKIGCVGIHHSLLPKYRGARR